MEPVRFMEKRMECDGAFVSRSSNVKECFATANELGLKPVDCPRQQHMPVQR